MFELYFLRHAEAEPAENYPSDSERPLSEHGKNELARVAKGMKALGLSFDLLLTSPLVRTLQTARIVAAIVSIKGNPELSNALLPGSSSKTLLHDLRKHPTAQRILLVGHEPDLGHFISFLISGRKDSRIEFRKAGLARVDLESLDKHGVLMWLLTPDQIVRFELPVR